MRWRRWLRDECRWDLLAAFTFTVVSLFVYATSYRAHVPGSDGHYSWMYARSLAYDHDFDFTNDYALCGDPFGIGWTTPANRPANLFYFGPALFWTPLVWLLKHVVGGEPQVAGGCVGPIPTIVLGLSSVAGGVAVGATTAILRRLVGARLAVTTALLASFGGLLLFYTAMSPSYSHAYDAMCVALYLYALVRVREDGPRARLLVLAGLALGAAILQRSSNRSSSGWRRSRSRAPPPRASSAAWRRAPSCSAPSPS